MASSSCYCSSNYLFTLFLVFSIMCFQNAKNCNAIKTIDFEIHHRFSDQVKAIMGADNLPEIGSPEYHAAMVHRDKVFHGRALSENDDDSKLLTLSHGADASYIDSLGALHYVNISLGTPSLSFFVALDTGTKLLWVPCIHNDMKREEISLNTYSVSSSSTSKAVTCNSSLCELRSRCSKSSSECSYKVEYNANISSFGVLVEDVLRLKTDNHNPKDIDARITFGCGQVQTGFYWDGRARNGLFGLGIGSTSVPSILSRKGLVADSFSMCFGNDRVGRISFGDKGSSDQQQTSLNSMQQSSQYNISVTQLSVGENLSDKLDVTAIFYSGAVYTYLNDPAYTALCDSFDSQIDKQHSAGPMLGFEYCYHMKDIPNVTFIMKGGSQFNVYYPMVPISTNGIVTAYCLGVIKSSGGNFIGDNFMTGHNIVFDREKMVLGWKASNCTDGIVDSRNDKFPPIPAASPAQTPTINAQPPAVNDGAASPPITNVQPPSVNDGAASPPIINVQPPSVYDGAASPTSPPPPTTIVQPPSINGGTARNGSNSSNTPQFSVGKPRNLHLLASSLLVLFLPILQIV